MSTVPFALFTLSLTVMLSPSTAMGDVSSDAKTVFDSSNARRGLFVVIDNNPDLAVQLAKTEPVVVLLLTKRDAVEKIRHKLVQSGIHGRVTVAPLDTNRLPLIDNLVAAVVVSGPNLATPARKELLRVVRPDGRLLTSKAGRWVVIAKPRKEGADDWPQYHYNAAMTDRSNDRLAGPARGIQWQAGDNSIQPAKMGVRVVGQLTILVDERGVVARDAYSGLPVWRRGDLKPSNRYAFLADASRVYLVPRANSKDSFPPHMKALDLKTGRDAITYSRGVQLGWACAGTTEMANRQLERTDRETARANQSRAQESYQSLQARLSDGVLLQTLYHEMTAVDAKTGKRLWSKRLSAESKVKVRRRGTTRVVRHEWHHPLIENGRVYVVEGVPAKSWSYTHWPMGVVTAMHCFDLKTGTTLWTWRWPKDLGQPAAAYNMTPVGEWLGLMLRSSPLEKSAPGIVFVKRGGKEYKHADKTPYGKSIGGGHSHARLLFVNGKVWVNGTTKPIGTIDLNDPGKKARWNLDYARLPRPVGCTVSRATPNYVFGSLTTYSLKGKAIQHTNAARAVCDVGAVPAAGMTFITPTQCFCAPYLPGFKAFHSQSFAGMEKLDRLQAGKAKPAAKSNESADWPMYMADARRSNWTESRLPKSLKRLWTVHPAKEDRHHAIVREWRDNWYTQGPITPVTVAEGIAAFAVVDGQQVVGLDPKTGKERWRTTVDGRIDSSPTIRSGLIYAGTRNGWVYALNRDNGELVWRFFAAPRRERFVSFGQLESRWPLHGSILVDEDGVWAIAGRHNDTDAGLWWWRLDPVTGKPLASGRLGSDELSSQVGVGRRSDGRQSGANTPVVSNGKLLLLAGIHLEKRNGKLVDRPVPRTGGGPGIKKWWADRFAYDIVFPGNQGLVFDYTQMGGYKMPYYGYTQAAVYAYNGNDFLHAGGTTSISGRGGSRGGRRTEVIRFRKFESVKTVPHPKNKQKKTTVGSKVVWKAPYYESDGTGLGGLAVGANAAFVGFSVESRDHRRAREKMPFRLRSFELATGKSRQADLPLPAKPVLHGISIGAGRVYVACEDGSIVCFGEIEGKDR